MSEQIESLHETIFALLQERGPMSAADITARLNEIGRLPEAWTVIDVADYMREWFS